MIVHRSKQFDLGLDKTRMKDPDDAERQTATVDALLERFFARRAKKRWEVQVLADEVGMGKTFVALAVAYSVLEHLLERRPSGDLKGCYRKVLVVTPNNAALFSKWQEEVSEFVNRCVHKGLRREVSQWFAPVPVDRIDRLSYEAGKPGGGKRILITKMSAFSGGWLRHYDIKRQLVLRALFRHWGNALRMDARKRLLRGAPEAWPRDPRELGDFEEYEWDRLFFDEDEVLGAIKRMERGGLPGREHIAKLREDCGTASKRYARGRRETFEDIENGLNGLYKDVCRHLIRRAFPLVIVDEAHNWKNHRNGYSQFRDFIAPKTRRLLLLTATPFQLHPGEMLDVLEVSDTIRPCPTKAASRERVKQLTDHREQVIRPALERSDHASRSFTEAWGRLSRKSATEYLGRLWQGRLFKARNRLYGIAAKMQDVADEASIGHVVDSAVAGMDPRVADLMREALRLYTYNADLSGEMGALVIRHRRRTEHRLFKVGSEYLRPPHEVCRRPDSHILHGAPGIDVTGEGELPHYILMRCVTEMKRFKGRSSLGSALTGCYSTLLHSAEGKKLRKQMESSRPAAVYLDLLFDMVDKRKDPRHPKVRRAVDTIIKAWEAGEKSLVFCFRVNTAERLSKIIDREMRRKLAKRRMECLGGAKTMKSLRARLTSREQDLVVIGLDRVLWSLFWVMTAEEESRGIIKPDDLALRDGDLEALADLGLKFQVDLAGERVDRVFLNRAIEHVIAGRILTEKSIPKKWSALLEKIAETKWISLPYGEEAKDEPDEEGEERPDFDERGVHSRYGHVEDPGDLFRESARLNLAGRRERAKRVGQLSVVDTYAEGPSLWLGSRPQAIGRQALDGGRSPRVKLLERMHKSLFNLTLVDGRMDLVTRKLVYQALRRAVLRESVLLRLLPTRTELKQHRWGELLVDAFFEPLPGQGESMADRISVFIEDLLMAGGGITESGTARHSKYEATRLRDQNFIALVTGKTDPDTRKRIFAGFNTPLLPEVLVCSRVGQEGIDLHLYCRHVLHYDLAWNPAVLEQRTGRTDRIGSKASREWTISKPDARTFLEIGVPYLAGTYDERMYEELKLRAQVFEVLTGGDLATDDPAGYDDADSVEGEPREIDYVPLPENMVKDLRVRLHVWGDSVPK